MAGHFAKERIREFGEKQRKARAEWFAENDQAKGLQTLPEFAQRRIREMVQDEAAYTGLSSSVAEGLEKISASPINRRWQTRGPRHQVETCYAGSRQRGMDFPAKAPLARSDFHDSR